MDSSKMSAFLITLIIFISSTPFALACGTCKPPRKSGKGTPTIGLPPVTLPPVTLPPVTNPPVTLPPVVTNPPVTLPPVVTNPPVKLPPVVINPPVKLPPVVTNPPVTLPPVVTNPPVKLPPVVTNPPVKLPPVTLPPVTLPPVTLPPVTLPPVGTPPVVGKPGCAPAKKKTCPVNTLKLNGCVDLLGGLVHLNIGKASSTCCPLLKGLAGVDAALCLCTTIKAKLLNINVALPIALELLVSCGKTPPAGFTCP